LRFLQEDPAQRTVQAMASIEREVRRLVGRAISCYALIQDGDRMAVGVSGGKDSLLLLWLLRDRLQRIPIHYELTAVHVDPGFDAAATDSLQAFFHKESFDYRIIPTDYGLRAHSPENRENPCFLCARLRRTALFREARNLNCQKIALGHNQDDLIETFFINICYSAQTAAMVPKQPFFGGEITIIRPLSLVPAAKVERLCQRLGLPIISNTCPSANENKRQEIRGLLDPLFKQNPKVRGNIYHAMSHVNHEYLPPPLDGLSKKPALTRPSKTSRDGTKLYGSQENSVPD
jgi:tRNA 2-thiocytidine biosynthesis protein TtcA